MLTRRGRWLIVLAIAGAALGLIRNQTTLALLGLSILVWLFGEWFVFRWRMLVFVNALKCQRVVNRSDAPTGTLWTDRPVDVEVTVEAGRHKIPSTTTFRDCVPENLAIVDGDHNANSFEPVDQLSWRYTVVPRGVGTVTLPGVHVTLADLCGFFTAHRFVNCSQSFRVYPSFVDLDDVRPVVKRINAIPTPGIHRLKREGMGFELLELREYVPGDPPKSIAWKVSARRDTLMTRQYESEVPVRTMILFDSSIQTRIGGFGGRLLDQMAFVAMSIARSSMTVRDPVGMTFFDESGFKRINPGMGERHFYHLLKELNTVAISSPPESTSDVRRLLESIWKLCHERYPERLDPRVNIVPWSLFPLFPKSRKRFKRRTRLAALFTQLYHLPIDVQSQLIYDDRLMSSWCHQFLTDAGMAWMEPAIEDNGKAKHDCIPRLESLSSAITNAVAYGKDNELFVILVDLLDCSAELHRILPAIRLALSRHHRVSVICPTPDFRRPDQFDPPDFRTMTAEDFLLRAQHTRINAAAETISREFRRIGVAVSFSADRTAIKMVLNEADITRHGRSHRGAFSSTRRG